MTDANTPNDEQLQREPDPAEWKMLDEIREHFPEVANSLLGMYQVNGSLASEALHNCMQVFYFLMDYLEEIEDDEDDEDTWFASFNG